MLKIQRAVVMKKRLRIELCWLAMPGEEEAHSVAVRQNTGEHVEDWSTQIRQNQHLRIFCMST